MHPSPHPHPSPSPRPQPPLFFFFFYHRRCWLPPSWRGFFAWLLAAPGKKLVATERPPSPSPLLAPLAGPWAGTSSEQLSTLVGIAARESNGPCHCCSYYCDGDEQRQSARSQVLVHVLVVGCGCAVGLGQLGFLLPLVSRFLPSRCLGFLLSLVSRVSPLAST